MSLVPREFQELYALTESAETFEEFQNLKYGDVDMSDVAEYVNFRSVKSTVEIINNSISNEYNIDKP